MGDKSAHRGEFSEKYTETGDMCYAGEVKTAFATEESITTMKAMVADAKPEQVINVADAWKGIHEHLAGGGGSVKSDFDRAVEHVLQHWEGESADEFAKKAKKISKQIGDCATYAHYTSTAMRNAGERLSDIKPKVEAIEKPGTVGSAMDRIGDGFSRDDNKWKGEIHGKQGAQQALDKHGGELSAGKEEQLKAAAHMETLALAYSSQTKTMGSWNKKPLKGIEDPKDDYPGHPGGVAPVPVPVAPDGSGPGAAAAPGTARTGSSSRGRITPKSTSPNAPGTGAKVDGISGGTSTGAGRGGGPAGTAAGGGLGGGAGAGAGSGVGGTGGVAGGPGLVGQASANRGIAGAAGRGAGGRAPAGLGGGAGPGAGGKGAAGAAGRGPLARQRGGTLDTPQQGKGAARQGGQGLHSSRGGAQAGERGRNANGGMRGGVGGGNKGREEEEKSQGQRPDYLVEDEETWMPERRDVAPPTIG